MSGGIQGILENPGRETELLVGIARRVLDQARDLGAEQAEVSVSSSLGREVTVRLGEVDVLEEARDRGVSVTVYKNRCTGTVSSGDLRPEAIDEAVTRAMGIARQTQPDPASGLADAERMATEFPDLDLWHPEDLSVGHLLERARLMEQAGLEADNRIDNSEGATVATEAAVGLYANSHGFLGTGRRTRYSQSCILVARDDSGMQRDYDWDQQRRWSRLADPAETGRKAAERAARRLNARKAPTGPAPVLFVPEMASELVGHLVGAVSGRNLYRRSSFLIDAAGQRLFPAWVEICECPRIPGGVRSSAFDSEGVATAESPLIHEGMLVRYVLGSYSARKLGLESTANAGGVRNLIMAPGELSQDELVAGMERGLVVTEVMGQGVNLVTGDYSRGAAGFWVERGEIAYPVEEITIAGNLRDVFAGLNAAGSDVETRRNIQTPSLRVDGLTIAGS